MIKTHVREIINPSESQNRKVGVNTLLSSLVVAQSTRLETGAETIYSQSL